MRKKVIKDYLCSYHHQGSNWSLTIKAYDWDDAQARVAKLGNLKIIGEHVITLPAGPGMGVVANSLCYIKNKFTKSP